MPRAAERLRQKELRDRPSFVSTKAGVICYKLVGDRWLVIREKGPGKLE